MKKSKKKLISIFFTLIICIISINTSLYAHSGRTDSNGGHKDNKNKSGLGSYHYHCGGHPAHLHTNGICPYSTSSSSSTTKTTTTTTTPKTTTPTTIDVTDIKINENIANIEVGENKTLTATITPYNATNKDITWKSSDESIATVSTLGEVIAKKGGIVDITASTSNGKTSTIQINVKEEKIAENNTTTNTTLINKNNTTNNTTSKEESNTVGGILLLGILGGSGYLIYKNKKK